MNGFRIIKVELSKDNEFKCWCLRRVFVFLDYVVLVRLNKMFVLIKIYLK